MSKLGKKIMLTVAAIVLAVSILLVATSLFLTQTHTDELMLRQSDTGVKVLRADLEDETTRLKNIADYWGADNTPAKAIGLRRYFSLEESWNLHKGTDSDFCALFDATGELLWSTENYAFSGFDPSSSIAGATVSGIYADSNVPLSLIYVTPTILNGTTNGVVLLGTDLARSERLDSTSEKSGGEATIFAGKTRYATTVRKANGERAVGTDMSEKVETTVIKNGETYTGQADILGQKHYVHYEPIYDINGKIVGAYFAGYSSEDADETIASIVFFSVLLTAVLAVVSGIIIILTTRHLVENPIREACAIADSMSKGELSVPDSTFRFANDEVGQFAMRLEQTKHTLSSYINDISRILSEMAKGNFAVRPGEEYKGDFIEIDNSFTTIGETLSETIRNLNTAAVEVTNGSEQFANSSQILSDGTAKQAGAIDHLSKTIDEISKQVERSAENSAQANEYSKESAEKIGEQSREIASMMEAMEEIKNKSNEIGKIIKTIDDIAFQTNILALNAAVEAARAGEAGKGFAVVADEVRNLAAKSAEAASSTTELISSTIDAVTDGAKITEKTAVTMKEVIEISEKTNVLIDEISKAAAQQSDSIKDVTHAIGEISVVVQNNSATAEETTASCEQLNTQSVVLKEQIARFKVG